MSNPLPQILAEQVAVFRKKFFLESGGFDNVFIVERVSKTEGKIHEDLEVIESFLQESLTEAYRAGGEEMYKAIKKAEEIKAQEMTQPVFRGNMMSESLTDKAHERFLADISKDGAITP